MTDEDAASTIDVVIVAFNSAARLRRAAADCRRRQRDRGSRGRRSRLGRLRQHRRGGGCGLDPRCVEPRVRRRAEQRPTADDRTIRARAEPGPDDRHRRGHPRRRNLRGSDDRGRAGRDPGGVDGHARAQCRAAHRAVAPLGATGPRPRPAADRSRSSVSRAVRPASPITSTASPSDPDLSRRSVRLRPSSESQR